MRGCRAPLMVRSARHTGIIALSWVLLAGCASSSGLFLWPQETFPPRQVIEKGDYHTFLVDNQRTLERCDSRMDCDVTLFNLGFVYAYPPSPYRDPQKARQYLRELQNRYPSSPWTTQGRVLLAFMNGQVGADEAQRRLRTELRSRDATIRKLREQLYRSREIDIEMEKKERDLLR